MRIVLDAMGSDNAPGADVLGGVNAARRFDHEIVLVGRPDEIERELDKYDTEGLRLSVLSASQVISMHDHPSEAVRAKPDASMVVGMGVLRQGQADAFVSAGNSGGVMASALIGDGHIGRIKGIQRPAISAVVPGLERPALLLDIGANTDCKPQWLAQFAVMGAVYVREVMGVQNPRVGLLSNGEEDIKGNQAVQEARELIRQLDLNFVGNVEGKDIFGGVADVIVADGFAGNVALKTAEGVASMLLSVLKREIKARPLAVLGALLAKPAFKATSNLLDYREHGGAILLGVNGVVIIGHGRSDALAIENAVGQAVRAVEGNLVPRIQASVQDALSRAKI